jgi:AcrR family transcriptional regulator
MVSSAVYRYFASRDELLTALIIDAYEALGVTAEAAAGEGTFTQRYLAVGHAVRDWAVANPHEWALIYGSPVPGYRAPQDTVGPATRVILLIGRLVRDAYAAGETVPGVAPPDALAAELTAAGEVVMPDAPADLVARAMGAWVHVCGAVSAELFGQFNNTIDERRAFFDLQLRTQATLIAW